MSALITVTMVAYYTPSTVATKLANDRITAFRVTVFVTLESPVGVIDLDFRVVE
jgi:hypothetical protein